ncbi:MAG: hypothetical protein NWS46_07185 [Cyclobacteriaceae bacterium]|nr:hypothetical protein [Cyclobacteriaceae bacterium]
MRRRDFIVNSSLMGASAMVLPQSLMASKKTKGFKSLRPKKSNRNFVSDEVERVIEEIVPQFKGSAEASFKLELKTAGKPESVGFD